MMNAARVFARALRQSRLKGDLPRLASTCQSFGLLVDFLHDVASIHPKWGKPIALYLVREVD